MVWATCPVEMSDTANPLPAAAGKLYVNVQRCQVDVTAHVVDCAAEEAGESVRFNVRVVGDAD
jgi:hypothetical protein